MLLRNQALMCQVSGVADIGCKILNYRTQPEAVTKHALLAESTH